MICEICHGQNFWLDIYSENSHCEKCDPPISEVMVKNRISVTGNPVAENELANHQRMPLGSEEKLVGPAHAPPAVTAVESANTPQVDGRRQPGSLAGVPRVTGLGDWFESLSIPGENCLECQHAND